jgi:tight adherence protein B
VIGAVIAGGLALLSTLIVAGTVALERRSRLFGRLEIESPSPRAKPRMPTNALARWLLSPHDPRRSGGREWDRSRRLRPCWWPDDDRAAPARRRDRGDVEHLAEAVSLIASAMRSGRSLRQAIELAASERDAVLAPTFRRLGDRTGLGDSTDEAIDAWAIDVGGPDARLVAGVLKLHRRTGGSLAATLENLAATLRERRGAARELESLTAQARLSATILGLLPIGFFLFLSIVARRDLQAAYEMPAGIAAIGLGLGLQVAAFVWIRHLLRVEP